MIPTREYRAYDGLEYRIYTTGPDAYVPVRLCDEAIGGTYSTERDAMHAVHTGQVDWEIEVDEVDDAMARLMEAIG